jgi:hypothetical protein
MDDPQALPPVELSGSRAYRPRTIEGLIARLECMLVALVEDDEMAPASEVYGPYVDAPGWPWLLAGWTLGSGILLLFVISWVRS